MGKVFVDDEQIKRAKNTSLYQFLLKYYPDEYKKQGNSLIKTGNFSLHISKYPYGNSKLQFTDFNGSRKGDSIDYLINYLDYDFSNAVLTLCGERQFEESAKKSTTKTFVLPSKSVSNDLAIDYLVNQRGIDKEIILQLIDEHIIEQVEVCGYERIMFVSKERNFYEIHEIKGDKFRRTIDASKLSDNFWWFHKPCNIRPKKAYVCEAAIDAISLYQIIDDDAYYCSIGGVSNKNRIQKIIDTGIEAIIAVDGIDDKAANLCRQAFPNCKHLIPTYHDWNADLLMGVRYEKV